MWYPDVMEAQLLTPNQVAERLQLSVRTVYAWLRDGRLPGIRLGRRWRVSEEGLACHLGLGHAQPTPRQRPGQPTVPSGRSTYEALMAILEDATRDVPPEAWDELPKDGAVNHDHYLYGVPKVKEAP